MEESLKIPLGAGKFAYGTFAGRKDRPLIIFVHGFTGYKDEHMFFNGASFFVKHEISSFRFNLYGEEKDARKFNDCALSIHAKDLDSVVSYFGNKSPKIIVIGHSFGGAVVVFSKNQEFDKAILWEPTPSPKELTKKAKYVKELDLYYFNEWGIAFTIGKEMIEENKRLNPVLQIKKFKKPVEIIVAGSGALVSAGKKYFENVNEPKKFAIIPNSTHSFDEDGAEEKLFQETLDFINYV